MIRAPAVVIGFAIFAIGCQPLPAGRVAAIQDGGRTRRLCNVYLIRGWQDFWSQGVDELAVQLRGKGFRAEVFRAAQWREVAGALAKASKDQSLVLIGFSYGADDVIEIARQLRDGGRSVDLLITIDPVTPTPVPANVGACYNFFQTNGALDVFPWLRGVPLKSDAPGRLVNVDLRRDRPDLLESNTAHSNIAANPKLHREIVGKVVAACIGHGTSNTSTEITEDTEVTERIRKVGSSR